MVWKLTRKYLSNMKWLIFIYLFKNNIQYSIPGNPRINPENRKWSKTQNYLKIIGLEPTSL